MSEPPPARCSFCNKPQNDVAKLIAGPNGVAICDECVEVCRDIIDGRPVPPARHSDASPPAQTVERPEDRAARRQLDEGWRRFEQSAWVKRKRLRKP